MGCRIRSKLLTARDMPQKMVIGSRSQNVVRDSLMALSEVVVVIVEGFLVFYDSQLCDMCDVQLWLEADCETCLQRRYHRRRQKRDLAPFSAWYRGLVWAHYEMYRDDQLSNARQALRLQAEDPADVLVAKAVAHCRAVFGLEGHRFMKKNAQDTALQDLADDAEAEEEAARPLLQDACYVPPPRCWGKSS